jgi:NhaC family Na+:H+ antiporter
VVLLPPAVVVWGIARRTPAALAIASSSAVALLLGMVAQGFGAEDAVVAAVAGFDADMVRSLGVDPAAVDPQVLTLVERGGLFGMGATLVIVFAAFLLAGAMEVYGALDRLIAALLSAVRGVFGLIAATMTAGATMIALTSHGAVTALVVGGLFQPAYDERGLARVNLSRSLEDSVTLTEPLMPWTVSAVFMASTLGVATTAYLPWAVFNYGGPVFSLLIASLYRRTGVGIREIADPAGVSSPPR